MARNSKIEWCDHTFNPWIGCTKVSPACDNCYAQALTNRFKQVEWGHGKKRKLTSPVNWKQPLFWNTRAERLNQRFKVFCASLADVFDPEVPNEWRDRLFVLIKSTPHLDWLVLTKRPKIARDYLAKHDLITNLWLGTTVENQKMANLRIPLLIDTPAAKHFLSCEPLLGPIDLPEIHHLDWVIAGGESGPKARAMSPDWARSLQKQCEAASIPFFFKQWGEWRPRSGKILKGGNATLSHPTAIHPEDITCVMERVGKKKAGQLLDGQEYSQFPIPACLETAS
ncbi:phage Gp37/Gp68 family protein [Kiloniella sp.]|uniref:phage Gp37/Gp68 family protein n=1 Tax=Kiloniella sp. TaxID=1938587 RepID=UPI003B0285B4